MLCVFCVFLFDMCVCGCDVMLECVCVLNDYECDDDVFVDVLKLCDVFEVGCIG